MALGGVISETLQALLLPRRLIPIVLVCLPLLAAQGSLSEDPLAMVDTEFDSKIHRDPFLE
jgi:hypothetical protein